MSIETPTRQIRQRLDNIQALRGIAALAVVFYHIGLFVREGVLPGLVGFPEGPWDRGWVGVDLFFVISGFIMVWTMQSAMSGPRVAGAFLYRRVTRIYPLWWVCAGIMAVYFVIAYGMPAPPDRVSGSSEAWGFALKSFALWPQDVPPLLGVGWTLIFEMWFYLVFAVLLCLPQRLRAVSLAVWAGLILIGYAILAGGQDQPVRDLIISPLSLEFIAGAVCAGLVLRGKTLPRQLLQALLALAVVWVLFAMTVHPRLPVSDHHWERTLLYGPALAVIVWGTTQLVRQGEGLPVPDWLVRIGDWSYALYLIHYIVLVGLRRVMRVVMPDLSGGWIMIGMFIAVALVTSLILAWALHRWVERPALALFNRRRDRSPARMSG